MSDARSVIRQRSEADANGCWIWQGGRNGRGYGQLRWQGPVKMAHRLAYEAFIGPIPEGLHIDHLCRTRACVNPTHLEPVTAQVNVLRSPVAPGAVNAGRTHCPQGHEYTPENTYQYQARGDVRPGRYCRTCRRSRNAARAAA